MTIPLLYTLYCGDLYGTERMALATACGLAGAVEPTILAPHGKIIEEARRQGIGAQPFQGHLGLLRAMRDALRRSPELIFLATRCEQSFLFWLLNLWYRRKVTHLLVVHGGGGKNVYRRNVVLTGLRVGFIAVSDYVRECLVANGVRRRRIQVINNFLPTGQLAAMPQRGPFTQDGIAKVAVVSRLVGVKRIDLLLDALDAEPALAGIEFHIYGDGEEGAALKARAGKHPNVVFHGFKADAAKEIAAHDLLLHTAPKEPFGLTVLEAMAARVPVLVADKGGPASIVAHGETGFHFRADDAHDLADALMSLTRTPAGELDRVAARAHRALNDRFSEKAAVAHYRHLLLSGC